MQVLKIRRATLVALAAGSLAAGGSGISFADGHGAGPEGGSSTAGTVLRQNTAQTHRQNNNCFSRNVTALAAGRVAHCGADDASDNRHTELEFGGAHAFGGTGTTFGVSQQNSARQDRRNNNCAEPVPVGLANGSRAQTRCTGQDGSYHHHALVKGGGAHAADGPGTIGSAFQQNNAEEGRRNNACATFNNIPFIIVTDGRAESRCANQDRSRGTTPAPTAAAPTATAAAPAARVGRTPPSRAGRTTPAATPTASP